MKCLPRKAVGMKLSQLKRKAECASKAIGPGHSKPFGVYIMTSWSADAKCCGIVKFYFGEF